MRIQSLSDSFLQPFFLNSAEASVRAFEKAVKNGDKKAALEARLLTFAVTNQLRKSFETQHMKTFV